MAKINHAAGEFYFRAWYDEEDGRVEISEYGLRSIRTRVAYFTLKASFTWGKRSTKHGDFGWLPNIPAWCRSAEPTAGKYIQTYTKTKAGALRAAIAGERASRRLWKGKPERQAECDVAIAALQARLKRAAKH
ncbi:hypothetical protein NL532_32080 [Mesorhizobium sp. C120A]|uniref:hypothetical protein n=1 Tax=unclassified Mesorhizobium TaxID=325217 RepID=UPI00051977E7|nr:MULTISPECIES: hypothetical protein [unclassified Mesorhizobium]WJI45082.1 hypothetical protein NL532_32080 [Mesorhizobium sp. C120A]